MGDILIIDDDAAIRQLVATYVSEAGHAARQAADGADGLAQAREQKPDLIILDLNMPVMDGTRVLRALGSDAVTREVPVIALSAVSVPEMRDDMHHLGCAAYVTKPITFATLMAQVDKFIPPRRTA